MTISTHHKYRFLLDEIQEKAISLGFNSWNEYTGKLLDSLNNADYYFNGVDNFIVDHNINLVTLVNDSTKSKIDYYFYHRSYDNRLIKVTRNKEQLEKAHQLLLQNDANNSFKLSHQKIILSRFKDDVGNIQLTLLDAYYFNPSNETFVPHEQDVEHVTIALNLWYQHEQFRNMITARLGV